MPEQGDAARTSPRQPSAVRAYASPRVQTVSNQPLRIAGKCSQNTGAMKASAAACSDALACRARSVRLHLITNGDTG